MKPKFRAWDTENNCFFKPTYEAYRNNLEEIVLSMSGDINIRTMSHTLDHESTFPNRFILNQYTGLKDKKGVEICEGDIYKWLGHEVKDGKQIRPVRIVEVKFTPEGLYKIYCLMDGNGTLEVIGNIYQNPELLAVMDS